MSTPVRKIVREESLMLKLLNGWASSNFQKTRSKSVGPKSLDEHVNLDERVRRTVGVQTRERLDRLKHFTSRVS